MLFLVATPIGNLGDITYRAVETLGMCDLVLCEDTRRTRVLLDHYGIDKPLKSYEKFSEAKREEGVLEELKGGKKICLVSDAGTPGISDPGERLVKRCHEENIAITVLPGACALVAGLTLSGFETAPFQFLGFLPKKGLKEALLRALEYEGTTVCYESPHRIEKTLQLLDTLDPKREVAVCRELTKMYEEVLKGRPGALGAVRGEIVLVIKGNDKPLFGEEAIPYLQETYGLSLKEALKLAASLGKLSRNELYKKTHK